MYNIEINSKGESLQTFLNTVISSATKLSHLPTIFLLTGFYWDGRTASESLNREVLPPVSTREGNRLGWQTGAVHLHLYRDRKSTRLNSSHVASSYAVFCLKKKKRR